MQEHNLNEFLEKLEAELPELSTNDHLLKIFGASHAGLFRLRASGRLPHIKLSSCRILYLKKDVLDWVKRCYAIHKDVTEEPIPPIKTKKPSKRSNKLCGARK